MGSDDQAEAGEQQVIDRESTGRGETSEAADKGGPSVLCGWMSEATQAPPAGPAPAWATDTWKSGAVSGSRVGTGMEQARPEVCVDGGSESHPMPRPQRKAAGVKSDHFSLETGPGGPTS